MKGAIAGGATCATVSLIGAVRLGIIEQLKGTPEKLDLSNLDSSVDIGALLKEIAKHKASKAKEVIYKEGVDVTITLKEQDRALIAQVLNLAPPKAKIKIEMNLSSDEVKQIMPYVNNKSLEIRSLTLKNPKVDEMQDLKGAQIANLLVQGKCDDKAQIPAIILHLMPQQIGFKEVEPVEVEWKEVSKLYQLSYIILSYTGKKSKKPERYDEDLESTKESLKEEIKAFNQLNDSNTVKFDDSKLLAGGTRYFTYYANTEQKTGPRVNVDFARFLEKRPASTLVEEK
ncbi:MAG: hypothetical protein JSR80_05230 [Verrucomicrobia bacterium]|nr:hypothetical protein [Verrucomicrobiota bacterium]